MKGKNCSCTVLAGIVVAKDKSVLIHRLITCKAFLVKSLIAEATRCISFITSCNFFAMLTIGLITARNAACIQKQNIQLKQLERLEMDKPYWQKMQNGNTSVTSTFKQKKVYIFN